MNVSLVNAAAAMNANARWQEVISENLSASSVPGFRRQQVSFSAVAAGVMRNEPSQQHWSLPKATNSTSFERGQLNRSAGPYDVAIEGPGFFEVQMADGSRGYTRDGSFQTNAQGQLVTKQGYLVMGSSGPIQFDRNSSAPVSISPEGEVSQGADNKGQLKVVDFNQPQQLTPVTGGYFVANSPGLMPEELRTPAVRHGFLEGANTSSVAEMANLITAMRGFETNQRIVQLNDERMGRAISELGNPN
jgi:flagellar basal body rod protein FlgG